ncbi:uncharacterized protein ZBIST_3586 [Zygosaccharomyces bailii]|uniref:BN860_02036g1_1 n=1 Tax=Zygosaccharomyces bailii (strain CLIB 213 / ATCC 58445 / CBS 680 / BCRC 21525 / NBRC 1098 / NCYC 1416 / NRRL Y-2227) TaxID=1333698 RepID=A0A8J2T4V2_ZYGB2|nr:BN860_02036g1_1 [Zygosaccharomyces bailii CLIB 213]CDH09082.1 uncharacterized protein ZBAI_00866 [Zygosaccharomyces bailii ISA1307]SJM87397.1 uncharacterized protein ZBIST_3586 [Zygosaccharomyces bailii]
MNNLLHTDHPPESSVPAAQSNESSFDVWNQELLSQKRNTRSLFNQPNPHSLNDRSIQEALSPFFNGVDVAHLPMTNPPIFQSSVTRFDEPIRRRRISISNGQISQLGEDVETLENLHDCQVPPMPPMPNAINGNGGGADGITNRWGATSSVAVPQTAGLPPPVSLGAGLPQTGLSQGLTSGLTPVSAPASTPTDSSTVTSSLAGASSGGIPVPGTAGWKRARLLERNRVAASKCRQRKKVAQLQLQKDFDILSQENKVIKKKLDYYEKLVTKFKTFFEAHLSKCASGERESLEIIESMLRIDSGVSEVDDAGLVVKMET